MIGARSISALLVAALAWAWAASRGVLDAAHIDAMQPSAALIVGLFSGLALLVITAFWKPSGTSVFAIGFHRGRPVAGAAQSFGRRASDLPRSVQRLLYLSAFVAIGLGSFGNAAAAQLQEAWAAVAARGGEYCREPDADARESPGPVVDRRGCALVRRAFELGYEKSLGSCATPSDANNSTAETADSAAIACAGRKDDEPLFHYMWRLLARRADETRSAISSVSFERSKERFSTKLNYARPLLQVPAQAILGTPHAAHHLWTNLPAPNETPWIADVLRSPRCTNSLAEQPPSINWSRHAEPRSALLASAIAQLVFSRRYGEPSLACGELTIHWGAAAKTCASLIEDSSAVLDASDATESVDAVISRHQSLVAEHELAIHLGEKSAKGEPPALTSALSFSCLMVGETTRRRATTSVGGAAVDVAAISVADIQATGGAQLEVYQLVSELLTGVRYSGGADDRAMVALRFGGKLEPTSLDGESFELARLEVLEQADPFLGDEWPLEREDLAEVYPFESHLRRVAVAFRRRYGRIRGRL